MCVNAPKGAPQIDKKLPGALSSSPDIRARSSSPWAVGCSPEAGRALFIKAYVGAYGRKLHAHVRTFGAHIRTRIGERIGAHIGAHMCAHWSAHSSVGAPYRGLWGVRPRLRIEDLRVQKCYVCERAKRSSLG